jgi:hypothetical protein
LGIEDIFRATVQRDISSMERQNPTSRSIVTSEDMEQYQLLHYILQASRVPIRFSQLESDIPASIFIFDLQEPKNPELRFDYTDDVALKTLYLRMGKLEFWQPSIWGTNLRGISLLSGLSISSSTSTPV